MEDKKANIIAVATVITLIVIIVIARVCLHLSKAFFLIAGAGIAIILAVLVYVVIRRRYNRRRLLLETQLVTEGRELRIEYSFLRKVAGVPIKFRLKELEDATDNFQALLGKGASASVFKGILTDGTSIAVKRIEGEERGEKEFKSEVAAIASVQHVNLVRLLGYCIIPSGPKFLVYEFISNGSLDNWIFPGRRRSEGTTRPGGCLSWDLRYRVAIDVARGLNYLHHDCRSRILHLDVKPENILLDENYRAMVSDFGLSKLMNRDESRVVTTIRGTRGYLAPEWLLEQGVSEKCDVYSFGMVLLEIIGGRRNVTMIEHGNDKSKRKWQYFPKIVNEKMREGKLMEIVDSRIVDGGIDERQLKRLVRVAFWCIQESARRRPTMSRVVEMLEGRATVDEPPDTQMAMVDFLAVDDDQQHEEGEHRGRKRVAKLVSPSSSNVPTPSIRSFSMSVLSGR